MVSDSEDKAQKILRKFYGEKAFIRKLPDFKTTGLMTGGLPDYLIIHTRKHRWFEIKNLDVRSKSFPHSAFTPQQLIVFRQMFDAGAKIFILITQGKKDAKRGFMLCINFSPIGTIKFPCIMVCRYK